MPEETDRKMMEILRILSEREEVLGAKTIAEELRKKGLTERMGYAGRKITEAGLKELEKGLIYDQVDFIFSKFEDMIYKTTLNPAKAQGTVVVNRSTFNYSPEIMGIIKEVFANGLAVSPFITINDVGKQVKLETICGTTIDGMLLKNGIPVIPQYGGLVKIENLVPIRFTELIAYKKTSMTPLEAFTDREMTSVLQVVREGNGLIPANFRLIPQSARQLAAETFQKMNKIGVSGLIKMGESGESVLGVPVDDDMVGIAVIGGISPLCAAKEAGFEVNIRMAENTVEFSSMKRINTPQPVLKTAGPETNQKVKFLLSKAWNLIYMVDFNLETHAGKVITNISHVNTEDLEDALEIFNKVMSSRPDYCISKYFQIIPNPETDQTSIATVCSLTIDGILNKHGISTAPQYGGILETEAKVPRFIELTAYSGSSLDPHEIYLSKGMTSVLDALKGRGRILASIKEIPYIARPEALEILEEVKIAGFSILNVGKPSELIYNAKVERYHAGIVTPGGLNPIAAIREHGIHVEPKAVETIMDVSQMEEF